MHTRLGRRPDLLSSVYETRTPWRAQYVAPPAAASLRVAFDFELNVLTGTYLVDVLLGNAETEDVP